MVIRPRALSGTLSFFAAIILLAVIIVAVLEIILRSFDPNSAISSFFSNNIVADVAVVITLGLIGYIWSQRKGVSFYGPVFFDDRDVFSSLDLEEQFATDGTSSRTKELGWIMRGKGKHRISTLIYKPPIERLVTVTAQFCPIRLRKHPKSSYWRCGIAFFRPDGSELTCCHIDNHNLVVGILGGVVSLKTPFPKIFEGRYSTLSVFLSYSPEGNSVHVYFAVDLRIFPVGTVEIGSLPLRLEIRSWSDDQLYHIVKVRDISVAEIH